MSDWLICMDFRNSPASLLRSKCPSHQSTYSDRASIISDLKRGSLPGRSEQVMTTDNRMAGNTWDWKNLQAQKKNLQQQTHVSYIFSWCMMRGWNILWRPLKTEWRCISVCSTAYFFCKTTPAPHLPASLKIWAFLSAFFSGFHLSNSSRRSKWNKYLFLNGLIPHYESIPAFW